MPCIEKKILAYEKKKLTSKKQLNNVNNYVLKKNNEISIYNNYKLTEKKLPVSPIRMQEVAHQHFLRDFVWAIFAKFYELWIFKTFKAIIISIKLFKITFILIFTFVTAQ